ncbi:MAG: fimbrillin family protein [Dysgonomonas sp.]
MKKIKLLIFTGGLLLLASCNNEEEGQGSSMQRFAPNMTASIDGGIETKSGVIEDNANYNLGELFYWNVGDATTLFFDSARLDYKVSTIGLQRNKANFTTDGSLAGQSGTYDIQAYYPISAWDFDNLTVSIPAIQVQTDNTSRHLSNYMVMKGESRGVTVNNKNEVTMQYQQLGSVLRILVLDRTTKTNVKLERIELTMMTYSNEKPFNLIGRLADKHATKLTTDDASMRVNTLELQLEGSAQDFRLKENGMKICEGYIALFPSQPLVGVLIAKMHITADEYTKAVEVENHFSVEYDLFAFSEGFKQGYSYYLKLLLEDN